MSVIEFRRLTLREYHLMRDGLEMDDLVIDKRNRLLSYVVAKPNLIDQNLSIFDFIPLEGDPTPEELQKIADDEMLELRRIKDEAINILKNYRK